MPAYTAHTKSSNIGRTYEWFQLCIILCAGNSRYILPRIGWILNMIFPAKKAHQNQYFLPWNQKKFLLIKINLSLWNDGKVLLEMHSLTQTDGNQWLKNVCCQLWTLLLRQNSVTLSFWIEQRSLTGVAMYQGLNWSVDYTHTHDATPWQSFFPGLWRLSMGK